MSYLQFKRSAVHNLVITKCRKNVSLGEISEGLVIPKDILEKADIRPWEQIVVTKIDGNNWINRLKTFVIEGSNNGIVEARGSLASFLNEGDLTCLITQTILNQEELLLYKNNTYPIFDLGFDPQTNKDNLGFPRLDIEYLSKKMRDIKEYNQFLEERKNIKRFFLSSLILNMEINKTHPDCLQGSAELPEIVMNQGGINKYQSVSVYNSSKGGVADTYAVPMPPNVVMTTGAMATFAPKGSIVNIATYEISSANELPHIILTDGTNFIKTLM